MSMMLKTRCNPLSGWGKGHLDQKTRMNRTKIKVIITVFLDWKGIVHH